MAPFSVTGDRCKGRARVGLMMTSVWDVSVGQPRKVFHADMGIKVRWFHEREVVAGYLGEDLGLRRVSVGVTFMDC